MQCLFKSETEALKFCRQFLKAEGGIRKFCRARRYGPAQANFVMACLRSEPELDAYLAKLPEPATSELKEYLRLFSRFSSQLKTSLSKLFLEFLRPLPHPPGGRPLNSSIEKFRKRDKWICERVHYMIGPGDMSLRQAKAEIARLAELSVRQIDRIWEKRASSHLARGRGRVTLKGQT
jgi:hypothetical protein